MRCFQPENFTFGHQISNNIKTGSWLAMHRQVTSKGALCAPKRRPSTRKRSAPVQQSCAAIFRPAGLGSCRLPCTGTAGRARRATGHSLQGRPTPTPPPALPGRHENPTRRHTGSAAGSEDAAAAGLAGGDSRPPAPLPGPTPGGHNGSKDLGGAQVGALRGSAARTSCASESVILNVTICQYFCFQYFC
jgi:hypothetical protein